uniref:Uncharacterized protein n=1 Tax=Caudovirales sp. ctkvU4 TaxID=2826783 RepID=A0A8S5QQI4_9CAUD|nr:MAG TPA: hypothetical protein [Caudovirales sp. ctkvU4]
MEKEKAMFIREVALEYLDKYGRDKAHEKIFEMQELLRRFHDKGFDVDHCFDITGRIGAIILQNKSHK